MTIYVNHVGFLPQAAKTLLMGGLLETEYEVLDLVSAKVVLRGNLTHIGGDFVIYSKGDFSNLQTPGTYIIRAGAEVSLPFRIGLDVYDEAIDKICGYFRLQRCGDSTSGWNGPCHLDDGLRGDTRQYQQVTGGWHDACDLRKWVGATIFGMLGLARLEPFSKSVEDELRWGNRYFLAMQEPDGYLMNFIGGDYFVHADNNRWTDNIADGKDDRLIDVQPCEPIAQWIFVLAESVVANRTRASDPAYAVTCLEAARRCAAWMLKTNPNPSAGELGAGISALLELSWATGDPSYQSDAVDFAGKLLALQVIRQVDSRSSVWGFFWDRSAPEQSPFSLEPYRDIWHGCLPLIGLCDLLEAAPGHAQAPAWRDGIRLFIEPYLSVLVSRNAFGIVPYGLYRRDPGGNRDLGRFWFRYFHEENPTWYVGINSHLASTGVALLKAAHLLDRPDWAALAQRQLDWILGANPFNASTVMGIGHNQPQHMFGAEFDPATPYLPGAVMNGISGDARDIPQLRPGSWQECEYWTPMVAYMLWMLSELRSG